MFTAVKGIPCSGILQYLPVIYIIVLSIYLSDLMWPKACLTQSIVLYHQLLKL